MIRVAVFLGIALLLALPFNVITYRQLTRLHPRTKRWVRAAIATGNLIWPFFPLLRSFTPFSRVVRAVLGPPSFAWLCFAIVYSGVLFLALLAWIPFRNRMPFPDFARRPSRVFLWIVIIGGAIGVYQALVPLRIERVPIAIANLPPALEGKRLALLADLHVGLFTRPSRLTRIFATTRELHPDAVLLAGDLIDDDPHFVPKLLAGTRALDPSTPLLAVLGNHETYGQPLSVVEQLRGSRIRLLVNEGVALGPLWIAGASDPAARQRKIPALVPDVAKALAGKPADAIPILLSHQPRNFEEAKKLGIPLTLAAHTHGGQLGFRPLRISLAGLFLDEHMGLYRDGAAQLYINTGTGYWLLPFRLGMTPEITLIELCGTDTPVCAP